MNIYSLNNKQVKKLAEMDTRYRKAAYIVLPEMSEIARQAKEGRPTMVQVMDVDRNLLGEITMAQAYKL